MQTRGFLRARVRFKLPPGRKFEDVLEDQKTRQTTSMQAVSYQHLHTVQVEIIVHSKQRRSFRRGTLSGWLGESVHLEVEHLEAKPIRPGPGHNKPFTSHETVKQFYTQGARLPVVCRFRPCRNPAGGCGIGSMGGKKRKRQRRISHC